MIPGEIREHGHCKQCGEPYLKITGGHIPTVTGVRYVRPQDAESNWESYRCATCHWLIESTWLGVLVQNRDHIS